MCMSLMQPKLSTAPREMHGDVADAYHQNILKKLCMHFFVAYALLIFNRRLNALTLNAA